MNKQEVFTDATDKMLAERLAALAGTKVEDDGFSGRVMRSLPRRDVSLWVVLAAVFGGLAAAVGVMGWEGFEVFIQQASEFFVSVFRHEMPSAVSWFSVMAVAAALGFVFYALLDTDDYTGVVESIE